MEDECIGLARRLFGELAFLHSHCRIVHSDIKVDNVYLLDERKVRFFWRTGLLADKRP
jgi:hypothetical protein